MLASWESSKSSPVRLYKVWHWMGYVVTLLPLVLGLAPGLAPGHHPSPLVTSVHSPQHHTRLSLSKYFMMRGRLGGSVLSPSLLLDIYAGCPARVWFWEKCSPLFSAVCCGPGKLSHVSSGLWSHGGPIVSPDALHCVSPGDAVPGSTGAARTLTPGPEPNCHGSGGTDSHGRILSPQKSTLCK